MSDLEIRELERRARTDRTAVPAWRLALVRAGRASEAGLAIGDRVRTLTYPVGLGTLVEIGPRVGLATVLLDGPVRVKTITWDSVDGTDRRVRLVELPEYRGAWHRSSVELLRPAGTFSPTVPAPEL